MQPIVRNFDQHVTLIRHASPVLTEQHDGSILMEHGDFQKKYIAGTAVHDSVRWSGINRVQDRFMNSTLFCESGEILDYRTSDYKGIIHTDDTIENLIRYVGTTRNGQLLRSENNPIEVELAKQLIGAGGDFNVNVNFSWSPFMYHLKSLVSTLRIICQNGGTILHELLANQVPVINDWERHLNIANKVLANRTVELMDNRFNDMFHTPADMWSLNRVRAHAEARMDETQTLNGAECLRAIMDLTDITKYSDVDQSAVDSLSNNYASRCRSHLSQYSLFNLATEMASHTNPADGSSENGIKALYNRILFDEQDLINVTKHNVRSHMIDPQVALAHHMM